MQALIEVAGVNVRCPNCRFKARAPQSGYETWLFEDFMTIPDRQTICMVCMRPIEIPEWPDFQCGQRERDAKLLAVNNLEMLEALEFVEEFFVGLERSTGGDDPLRALREKHAPIHDRLRPLIKKGRS